MSWILFLDDEKSPEQFDIRNTQGRPIVICKTPLQAKIEVLDRGMPAEMWLDHDLGIDQDGQPMDSLQFLNWLRYNHGHIACPKWTIMSFNPLGIDRIRDFMKDWEKAYEE